MLDLAEDIYDFLDTYCIGLDLSYDFSFKRFVLQETQSFISFHISVLLKNHVIMDSDKLSGLFIVTIYRDYIAINVMRKIKKISGHEYDSYKAHNFEEFQNIIINNMDDAIYSLQRKIKEVV